MTEAARTRALGGDAKRVVVVGLGLMGGSLAKAIRRRAPAVEVVGVDPDARVRALARDRGVRVAESFAACDAQGAVVVFAAPLDANRRLIRAESERWTRASLATDVTSLKEPILAAARDAARARAARVFVGAHPMCGSHRSGWDAARADLYEGADAWLCPMDGDEGDQGARLAALERARSFWTALGARARTIQARRHDATMAWASHLPQLLATALAVALDDAGVSPEALGPGGRDMTRLASSSASMWTTLAIAAARANRAALAGLEAGLAEIRELLEREDAEGLADALERGKRWRAKD